MSPTIHSLFMKEEGAMKKERCIYLLSNNVGRDVGRKNN